MKKEKARKILMIIGLAICMATLAVSIVFIAKIIELDDLRKTLIGVIIALMTPEAITRDVPSKWLVIIADTPELKSGGVSILL